MSFKPSTLPRTTTNPISDDKRQILLEKSTKDNKNSESKNMEVEVDPEGRELFSSFLQEEIDREGLENPDRLSWDSVHAQFRSPQLQHVGRELRLIADEFSKSKERAKVHRRADEVDLASLSKDHFFSLLEELFKGGLSRTRIVVLFFFCSDVAIRALKQKIVQYFEQFVEWALIFISQRICTWVREHGGWVKVLSVSFTAVYKGAIVVLGIAFAISALIVFRRKFF